MSSIVIDDAAILKCGICLDVYDKPKLLRCGHTFCAECLKQLYASSRELLCPECRRNVDGRIENLPPNFVIQRLLDDRKAKNDVESLTGLDGQLRQKLGPLAECKEKLLDTVRQQESSIQRKGRQMRQRVDGQVAELLEKLHAFRDDHLTEIRARQERVQTELDAVVRLCDSYGDLLQGSVAEENFHRLHALTEELLQRDLAYDDLRPLPSVVFTPTSEDGRTAERLVGHLDELHETENTLETTLAQGKAIWGMTIVDNKLYILQDHYGVHSYIDAYDAESLSLTPTPRHFPRFRGATDMASSARHTCLYVGDEVEKSVFKIGLRGGCDRWSLDKHKPWCVSVTFRDNVLVTLYDVNAIMEFHADGRCVRQMSLEPAGIVDAQQTLQPTANQLIVCHATKCISLLDSDGTPIQCHGGVSASTGQPVHGPCYLAVDQNHSVYVADVICRKVTVYSPELEFVREVVSDKQLKWWPIRLFVDNDRRRLYVADNKFDGQKYTAGRVLVFSLRDKL